MRGVGAGGPLAEARAWLKRCGLLPTQDRRLPSLVGLVTDDTLTTSWWSHPQARAIYDALQALERDPDIVVAKVLDGKDTFVHRQLWDSLVAVGTARDDWQLADLPDGALVLLERVDTTGSVQASGPAGRLLAVRLLVQASQVHTTKGRHERWLRSWDSWRREKGLPLKISRHDGARRLEDAARALGAQRASLPW